MAPAPATTPTRPMTAERVVPTGMERPAAPFPDEVALVLDISSGPLRSEKEDIRAGRGTADTTSTARLDARDLGASGGKGTLGTRADAGDTG
jgi:hypothetical protein